MRGHASVAAALLVACNALTGVSDLSVDTAVARDAGDLGEAGAGDADGSTDAALDAEGSTVFVGDADPGGTCPSFAVFCDSFETGDFTKWTTLHQTNGGKATVEGMPVRSGVAAMHDLAPMAMMIDGSYPSVGAAAKVAVPAFASGTMVVRGYWYFPKALGNETTFIKIIAKNAVDDMNLKISTNGGVIKEDTDVPGEGPELDGTKAPPIGKWFCVEWRITLGTDASVGHQVVVLDGETILDADDFNATPGGFSTVMPGFAASYGGVAQEMFVDDVAVAAQPIGCP